MTYITIYRLEMRDHYHNAHSKDSQYPPVYERKFARWNFEMIQKFVRSAVQYR